MKVYHFAEEKRIHVLDQKRLTINILDQVAKKNRLKDSYRRN